MAASLEDIHLLVGKIAGQVEMLVSQGGIQDDRAIALEARLRAVENRQHWYAGVAAVVSAAAAYVIKGWTGHS